jgi:hypothetical protein
MRQNAKTPLFNKEDAMRALLFIFGVLAHSPAKWRLWILAVAALDTWRLWFIRGR